MRAKRPGAKRAFSQAAEDVVERHIIADADYLADLEQNDGQLRKRMTRRERGKDVSPPKSFIQRIPLKSPASVILSLLNFATLVVTCGFLFACTSSFTDAAPGYGPEVLLYPKSEADIDAYGICRHVRNVADHGIVVFAVTPEAWPQSKTLTDEHGVLVMKVAPCK